MSNVLSLAPLFRQSVGFDRFNDLFESALRSSENGSSYPPYNVEKHGDDQYRIVVAAAGLREAHQALKQLGAQQAEHGLRAQARGAAVVGFGGRHHGDFGLLRKQGVRQALAKR